MISDSIKKWYRTFVYIMNFFSYIVICYFSYGNFYYTITHTQTNIHLKNLFKLIYNIYK